MKRTPVPPEWAAAWGRAHGMELGALLEAIRPNLESLHRRLAALADHLPPDSPPPPEVPLTGPPAPSA